MCVCVIEFLGVGGLNILTCSKPLHYEYKKRIKTCGIFTSSNGITRLEETHDILQIHIS